MNAIEIKNLSKNFGNKQAVSGLNMTVPMGAIYGFIGENGSGKSTTEKLICGLIHPSAGSIKLFGKDYTDTSEQINNVNKLLLKQANTDEPYKKIFKIDEFDVKAPKAIIKIPVPKKNDEAIDTPKNLLKITFKKVYKLAHPKLIIILLIIAIIKEPTFTSKEAWTNNPATTVPIRYVMHMQAIEKAPIIDLDNI